MGPALKEMGKSKMPTPGLILFQTKLFGDCPRLSFTFKLHLGTSWTWFCIINKRNEFSF